MGGDWNDCYDDGVSAVYYSNSPGIQEQGNKKDFYSDSNFEIT